ncbi:MAG: hypothetical protein CVU91_12015 [Firmicutes bacterium HGW-Firmicutes-16]|nr:MAG: hypothetical protein CVU91_12015 [Firmicutes bacterium HGW-Firmicutes-16]
MATRDLTADINKYYKDHLVSMEDAAKVIKAGDVVWMGQATQVPYAFLDELHAHKESYNDVTLIWNCANVPFNMIFDPDAKKHFRMLSLFCLPLERMSGDMGVMEYPSVGYEFTIKYVFEYGCNTIAYQVCPPDENGFCNYGAYGISNGAQVATDPRITKKIAFIDHGQYAVPGKQEDVSMHISEFDYIVENDTVLVPIPAAPPTDVDKQIASYILPYIHAGDKVEIGFGGLGEEILANLKDVGQLEIFSEVACDNMATLVEEGVLTKVVASSPGACSEKFFDFIAKDPRAQLIPTSTTINPFVIGKTENIVAINATFMVDLLGQACSESQGLKPYSGAGGSFAYIFGAMNAPGGRSFVCLRSTYKDKEKKLQSNIVPWLPEGSIVTTPKNYQMYIVSEWGIANVFLKTCKDRIKAIIKIAHPDFRQELKDKICTTPLISEADFENGFNLFNEDPADCYDVHER